MQRFWCLMCLLFLATHISYSQSGDLDLTFSPSIGANGPIVAAAIQSDGKIITVGAFTNFDGIGITGIVRLNSNGSFDSTFNPGTGTSAIVQACAIQSDGKIVIGGNFISYNGRPINYLARVNSDGSLDTTFVTGTGTDNNVNCITIQSDGKILIGGLFITFNGISRNRIARLNTDGSLDTGFNPGVGANASVEAIALQTDGKIVIGGDFTSFAGSICNRLARLDTTGSLDAGFTTIFAASGAVLTIFIQTNGQILIGGDFTSYSLQTRNYVARVNLDGSLDPSFNPGTGANQAVNAIGVQSNGEILIAGKFTAFNGTAMNRIALLITTGTLDPSFSIGSGADVDILSATIANDGRIIITGNFTNYDSIARNRIARLYSCTTPQPGPITGNKLTSCSGTIETFSISPVSGADNYTWYLPPGWSGSSDSTSITTISNGVGGVISVTANSIVCGSSVVQTDTIVRPQAPVVPLCLVTVDSQSTHNIIIWEKPQTTLIDSFYLYREVTTNVYAKIAAIPYDSLSEYQDYAADPNITSYKYKLSLLDSCGVESALSDYHNTIHLQFLGGGNLQWTLYQIENSGNPVTSYNVYRDDIGTGNFASIGTVPGSNSTFTDLNYSSFPNAIYVLDVNWSISCTPTRAVNTTRSNIRHNGLAMGIQPDLEKRFEIFPNPASGTINIRYPAFSGLLHFEVFNSLGQMVYARTADLTGTGEGNFRLNLEPLASAVYTLSIQTSTEKVIKKLILK